MNTLASLLGTSALAFALSACAANGTLTPAEKTLVTVSCGVANAASTAAPAGLKIAALLDPADAAAITTASAIDQLAHPAIVAACAAIGGTPTAVTVPTSTPTP
jgi:hypothetical protein